MKIGFVLDDSLDKADGVQQYILTLGKWYTHQGHEVHFLVGQTNRRDIPHIHSLSKNLQVHFNQNRMSTPLPAKSSEIKALLDRELFDVLHVQMPYSPFMAGKVIAHAPKQTAIVGTFHIIPYSTIEKLATKLLSVYLWRNKRRFDAVVSVSEPARTFARRYFGVDSVVVPNAVNITQFKNGKKIAKYNDGKLNIVFLGRLVERKGCMYLLEAIQKLHRLHQLDGVRVIICGKGPLQERLERYVRDNHLLQVVHFVGFVSEADKADYLATADIAVMPSTGGESFGIVLVEAMAAGVRVVIGGDNVGYRTVLAGSVNQLVTPEDTDSFSAMLHSYIADGRKRMRAFHWQQERVKEFDVAVVGTTLLRMYKTAIAKNRT